MSVHVHKHTQCVKYTTFTLSDTKSRKGTHKWYTCIINMLNRTVTLHQCVCSLAYPHLIFILLIIIYITLNKKLISIRRMPIKFDHNKYLSNMDVKTVSVKNVLQKGKLDDSFCCLHYKRVSFGPLDMHFLENSKVFKHKLYIWYFRIRYLNSIYSNLILKQVKKYKINKCWKWTEGT